MNYLNHYNKLVFRAKNRVDGFDYERHHIVPKCLGGSDEKANIVCLTPEEHYVAHQLLVKVYPNNYNLIYAAHMMTVSSNRHERVNNKIYGWIKRLYIIECRKNKLGSKNPSFGTCWISNLDLRECKRIPIRELNYWIELGWFKKRIINFSNWDKICYCCSKVFIAKKSNYCSKECRLKVIRQKRPLSRFDEKIDDLCEEYLKTKAVHKALINLGFNGTGDNAIKLMSEVKNRGLK